MRRPLNSMGALAQRRLWSRTYQRMHVSLVLSHLPLAHMHSAWHCSLANWEVLKNVLAWVGALPSDASQ